MHNSTMLTINPITPKQEQQVVERVADLLLQSAQHFERPFKPIEVRFDLRGRTSGMYVIKNREKYIRFNPYIFSKYFDDSIKSTIPHEVSHYVADQLFGFRNIRPHGKEWQSIMHTLGAVPRVTGNYDLSGIPVKRQKRFTYTCACMTHEITTVRHNRITQNHVRYFCQKCGEKLTRYFSGEETS